MALQPGTRFGPYEILGPLGAGGMGEVYRAKDTRLDRTVAIKVLPDVMSGDPTLRERFEREARAVSSLNHPHICSLYDIGRHEGSDYLVMEHIEGETLAQRLSKGALPIDQAIRFAIQIADALDKAHRNGVVHRDLKPANIMLTKSGAKLLDFGLAKLGPTQSPGAIAGSSTLLTKHADLTAEGAIVGTLQYMAPEQLEGKEADSRSDLFSFGSVLYEMVSGRKAFEGKSQASVIAAILTSSPQPASTLQPLSPAALDRVVAACLAKDPEDRWQCAHDLMNQLQWIAEAGPATGVTVAATAPEARRARLPWIVAAGCLLVALAAGAVAALRPSPPPPSSVRFTVPPPENSILDLTFAISPDGRTLAFPARREGRRSLWVRSLGSLEARSLPGTEEASMPFWSPDSRSVGFFADGKLKRINLADGAVQSLANAPDSRGGTWNADGVILFAPSTNNSILRIPASGGEPTPVTPPPDQNQESSHRWPVFLPDGRRFLYFAKAADKQNEAIYLTKLDSMERKRIINCHSAAAYSRSGHLVFVREHTLMAQPFDIGKETTTGEPISISQDVELVGENGPTGYAAFSLADEGVLTYRQAGANPTTQLVWVNRDGGDSQPVGQPGGYDEPSLSPDGRRVALSRADARTGTGDIWVLDLVRTTLSRFTFEPSDQASSIWSPDGSRLVYASAQAGAWDLYWRLSNGSAPEEPLLASRTNKFSDDWSRDGKYILYEDNDPNTQTDLWVLPLDGDRKPRPYIQTRFNEAHSQFSPDGRWVAYASDESGRSEIYVQPFPAVGGKFQVSADGGDEPAWRADGKELYFLSRDQKLMAVDIGGGATFDAGTPKVLFPIRAKPTGLTGVRSVYCASPDGKRFLVNQLGEDAPVAPITVVLSWLSDLKK